MNSLNWVTSIPTVICGIILATLPGSGTALALGAKGRSFLALSTAASFSIIAIASVIAPMVSLSWSIWTVVLFSIVIAAIAWVVRKLWIIKVEIGRAENWEGFGAHLSLLIIPAALIGAVYISAIPNPNLFSQTYDAIFHLNAVQWISDNGSASPFTLNIATPESPGGFYPSTWHAFASLLLPITGSVSVSTNVAALIVSAVVWPIAMLFFIRLTVGLESLSSKIFAAVIVASFPAFPLLLNYFGVLYPNLLGYALLPIPVALAISLLGFGKGNAWETRSSVMMLLGSLAGVGLAHPNSVYSFLALVIPVFVYKQWRSFRSATAQKDTKAMLKVGIITVLVLSAAMVVWIVGNMHSHWRTFQSVPEAILDFIFLSGRELPNLYLLGILAVVGLAFIFIAKQRQLYWILPCYLTFAWLFLVVTSLDIGPIRSLFVGIWYSDPFRIYALIPLVTVPLVLVGINYLYKLPIFTKHRIASFWGFVIVLLIGAQLLPIWMDFRPALEERFELKDSSLVVSTDEQLIFDYINENIADDEIIIGSPWNGSTMVYALAGNDSLFYLPRGIVSNEILTMISGLVSGDPESCKIALDREVAYLLDFGDDYIVRDPSLAGIESDAEPYSGLVGIQDSETLTLVQGIGQAKLYKVTGCN